MENIMLINLSQKMAMRRAMDITANNLANLNTTSYKTESVLFKEYLEEVKQKGTDKENLNFVIDQGLQRDFSEGTLIPTNSKLDFAITGDGFFVVETPDGPRYTRNGLFSTNANGELITPAGNKVLNDTDQPIVIDPENPEMTVAEDGRITFANGEDGGRLKVVRFENKGTLEKIGNSLYASEEEPQAADTYKILQGTLEGSNVSAIQEMTNIIEIMRSYQRAVRTEQSTSDLSKRAIERLGRIQS